MGYHTIHHISIGKAAANRYHIDCSNQPPNNRECSQVVAQLSIEKVS
jgi:hypothetical protein